VKDHVGEGTPDRGCPSSLSTCIGRNASRKARYVGQIRAAGDVVSNFVRVDHRPAERNEVLGRGRFAGSNCRPQ